MDGFLCLLLYSVCCCMVFCFFVFCFLVKVDIENLSQIYNLEKEGVF